MEAFLAILPCVCKSLELGLDKAIEIGIQIRSQDPTVADTLLKLVSDLHRYPKKDRKIILKFLKQYLEQNVSIMQSLQGTREITALDRSNFAKDDEKN